MALEKKPRRTFEDVFYPKDRQDYVTRVEGDETITENSGGKAVVNNKTKDAVISPAPINADGVIQKPSVKQEILKAMAPEPVKEDPKPEGPYTPMDTQAQAPVQKQAAQPQQTKDTSFPWDRALIGATPLLVGMLTGNSLEGAKVSSEYLVNSESDLYKRERDFDGKLNEMKARREMASSDGKSNYNKTEVLNPETGKTELWSTLNGSRYQFLGLKSPMDAKGAKPQYKEIMNPATQEFEVAEIMPGGNPRFLGKAQEKFKPDIDYLDLSDERTEDPNDVTKQVYRNGMYESTAGTVPASLKKGYTVEDRMRIAKYNKELNDPEIKFKQTRELNKDRESIKTTKNTRELAEAHGKIMNTTFGTDPISDVATVFALFKMMDPGSVVRESEQALGMGARSYEDLVNNVGPIITKQRYLTPTQIKNIRRLAQKMYDQQLTLQESSVDSQMSQRAKKYGLDPKEVSPTIRSPYKAETPPLKVMQGGFEYTLNPKTGEYE